jgi:hypothetical protein
VEKFVGKVEKFISLKSVVALTTSISSRRSLTLRRGFGVRRSAVSLVPVRVIIVILRRGDGSLVVCQDTDSDYLLTRVHSRRLARDSGPGPAPASVRFDVGQALFREQY